MSQVEFDAEVAARIESLYRIGDAVRRRRIVREAIGASGERILDVGCGPGFYCAELAEEVGSSGSVVGVDSSPAMLELAARRCAGQDGVELRPGEAVSLPVDDASFDAALCVQVLEYVADPTVAWPRCTACRPGGRVVVWDVDWAPSRCTCWTLRSPNGCCGPGSAPDPSLVAPHPRAADALGRLRTGSNAGASVRHVRVRPRDLRCRDAPDHRHVRRRTRRDHRRRGPAWSASNSSSAHGASSTSPHPGLLHGHQAVRLRHEGPRRRRRQSSRRSASTSWRNTRSREPIAGES